MVDCPRCTFRCEAHALDCPICLSSLASPNVRACRACTFHCVDPTRQTCELCASPLPLLNTSHDKARSSLPLPNASSDEARSSLPLPNASSDEARSSLPLPNASSDEARSSLPLPNASSDEARTRSSLPLPNASSDEARSSLPLPNASSDEARSSLPLPNASSDEARSSLPLPNASSDEARSSLPLPNASSDEARTRSSLPLPSASSDNTRSSLPLPNASPDEARRGAKRKAAARSPEASAWPGIRRFFHPSPAAPPPPSREAAAPPPLPQLAGGAPYALLAAALDAVEATRSRLAKDAILTNTFRELIGGGAPAAELEAACYLLSPAKDAQQGGHRLRPDWEIARPLSISQSSITAAVKEASGASHAALKAKYSRLRDLGSVALELCSCGGKQQLLLQPPPLMAGGVRRALLSLGEMTGAGCEKRKTAVLTRLLRAARGSEVKWLVRTFVPHMSCGISLEASVLPALAAAAVTPPLPPLPPAASIKAAAETMRHAFALRPDVGALVVALVADGLAGVRREGTVRAGVPAQPMLAKPASSVGEVIRRMTSGGAARVAAENKYDGQRAQLHRTADGTVAIFSRKNDEMTSKYPDVLLALSRSQRTARSFIVDAEIVPVAAARVTAASAAVALVVEGGEAAALGEGRGETSEGMRNPMEISTFQSLATRKRVHVTAANAAASSTAVLLFLFDLLLLDDTSLIERPFEERRALLREAFSELRGEVQFAASTDIALPAAADSPEAAAARAALDAALRGAVKGGCEGLMVKRLDSSYEPSTKRWESWLKLKKDYVDGMGDSLDLVPIGGWRGQGRKKAWISPWLLATYDPADGTLGSVCRVMSGFSDSFYRENTLKYMGRLFGGEPDEDEPHVESTEAVAMVGDNECESDGSGEEDAAAGDGEVSERAHQSLLLSYPAEGVETGEHASYWFEPSEVWEIRGADITVSPVHKAALGLVHADRGLSLRFPRFIRKRDDKRLCEATTPKQLAELYFKQSSVAAQQV